MGRVEERMGKLLIVRHGNTALNTKGVERGWQNPPLDDKGKSQAEGLANKLKGTKVDVLVSSDLERAVETAQILGKALGIDRLLKDWNLRTWNGGTALTGMDKDKADKIMLDYSHTPNKQLDGGESFSEFSKRAKGAIDQLVKKYPTDTILIVTHDKVTRLVAGDMSKEVVGPAEHIEYKTEGGKLRSQSTLE